MALASSQRGKPLVGMAKISAIGASAPPANTVPSGPIAIIAAPGCIDRVFQILELAEADFETFENAGQLLEVSGKQAPSFVLLWVQDTAVGLSGGIEPLVQSFPASPLIVLCQSIERWGIRAALSAGAAGVVLAESLDVGLMASLQAVHAGQICVPRAHWRQIEPPVLSSREKQILGLVVMGHTNGQIAERLFVAESTVKSHLSSAFGKLGVRSRNEAVHLILDPDRGLGMGILALGGEPLDASPAAASGRLL